jgi:hypothetical protein
MRSSSILRRLGPPVMTVLMGLSGAACSRGAPPRVVGYTPPHEFQLDEPAPVDQERHETPDRTHSPTEPIPMLGAIRLPQADEEDGWGEDDGDDEEDEEGETAEHL